MNNENPSVYLILVNWNKFHDTAECIDSLKSLAYPNFHIIIVDNGSSDDSALKFRQQFPEIVLIQNESNPGFAAGSNLGIAYL